MGISGGYRSYGLAFAPGVYIMSMTGTILDTRGAYHESNVNYKMFTKIKLCEFQTFGFCRCKVKLNGHPYCHKIRLS